MTYKRDLSGNTVYREVPLGDKQHLRWDEWGNLHSVEGQSSRGEYGYDVLGRRIYKRVESREGNKKQEYWYGWDGDRFITELYREEEREHYGHTTHIKGEIKGYGYHYSVGSYEALGQSVYLDGKNGLYYWSYGHYETDLNGMPLRLYGEDGELIWTARYSLWGEADTRYALLCRNHHQPLRYQGQYFDEETGLHYNRYRYYDAKCGVFISQDPIGLLGGLNPYQYALNSIGWSDPLGLSCSSSGKYQSTNILGRKVYKNTIDIKPGAPGSVHPSVHKSIRQKVADGWTNLDLMKNGYAPIGPDGKQINLHHILGKEPGPMIELVSSTHKRLHKPLHGLIESGRSFRNNGSLAYQYDTFRSDYWKLRALDFK